MNVGSNASLRSFAFGEESVKLESSMGVPPAALMIQSAEAPGVFASQLLPPQQPAP